MNQEQLSALLDGELGEEEMYRAIEQVAADEHLSRTWQRYHLIGAGLRREETAPNEALCARIVAGLEQEPVVLAPASVPTSAPTRRPVPATGGGRWLALAAGLAMVAVVGWWMIEKQGTTPLSGARTPEIAARAPVPDAEIWRGRPEMAEQLNALLVRHGEFTPASGMNGLAAYAKFVSHDVRP
jgi:negative regulator of sigma E activity